MKDGSVTSHPPARPCSARASSEPSRAPALRIRDLSPAEFRQRLTGDGIRLAAGPFNCRLQSGIPEIADELARLYAHHPLADASDFTDFHVAVQPGHGVRRWIKPQARF